MKKIPANHIPDKALARIQAAWKHAPHDLLSLWDMIPFPASKFYQALEALEALQMQAQEWIRKHPNLCVSTLDHLRNLNETIIPIEQFCEKLQMEKSLTRIRQFQRSLQPPTSLHVRVVESEILSIRQTIWEEFSNRQFTFIQTGKTKFFEQESLFGDKVFNRFDRARLDTKEAGNCLAADLNTAAVYHLMRIMEIGLLTLHKTLVRKRPTNPNWSALISDIEKAIRDKDKIQPWTPSWKKQRGFYTECASHFFFFKDKRNRAVHVELPFEHYVPPGGDQALRIFGQVKGFMQHLATKLKQR